MKVFVASDFHGNTQSFRTVALKVKETQADVLVICGDITHFGSTQKARNLMLSLTKLQLPIFFVPGNCDPPSLAEVDIENARCIHGACEIYGDAVFFGVGGGTISPFNTPFEMTETDIMNLLSRSFKHNPTKRWSIFVSHSPPKDTRVDLSYASQHVGSSSIREFIEEKKPSIVFCGHIHEAQGTDKIGETILVNPGPARHGHYALVNFNKEIEVKLDFL